MMDAASNRPSEKMRQRFSCGAILLLVIAGIGPVTGMARDLDLSVPEDAVLAVHRFSDWTPWMQMGDIPGSLIYSTYGWRVKKMEDLPKILKDAMEREEFALYREPPPPDDTRPMTDEYSTYRKVQTGEAGETGIRGQ